MGIFPFATNIPKERRSLMRMRPVEVPTGKNVQYRDPTLIERALKTRVLGAATPSPRQLPFDVMFKLKLQRNKGLGKIFLR